MPRLPLAIRLDPARTKEQIRQAATLGAKGVVLDATGELSPDQLSATGRRELRHMLRTVELALVALNLPTRRAFDTTDQLDDRLNRAERAFTLAFDLGTNLVLARVGALPPEADAGRRDVWTNAVDELGQRADHRGVRLALETGTEPGDALRAVLDSFDNVGLGASIDPVELLAHGFDPIAATRALDPWVVHAYGDESAPRPDWAEYLGALEEVNYRGFLTSRPVQRRR